MFVCVCVGACMWPCLRVRVFSGGRHPVNQSTPTPQTIIIINNIIINDRNLYAYVRAPMGRDQCRGAWFECEEAFPVLRLSPPLCLQIFQLNAGHRVDGTHTDTHSGTHTRIGTVCVEYRRWERRRRLHLSDTQRLSSGSHGGSERSSLCVDGTKVTR